MNYRFWKRSIYHSPPLLLDRRTGGEPRSGATAAYSLHERVSGGGGGITVSHADARYARVCLPLERSQMTNETRQKDEMEH